MPRLAGNFLAGLHSLFIGQSCKRFAREFRRVQKPDELHFTSVLSFLAVRNVSVLLLQFRIVTLHCAWQPSWSMYSAWFANTSLADCVAWERGAYAETRPAANNAVSAVTNFYLCACFSHPHPVIARLQEFPLPPPYRAQLIPASHKHSCHQPQPQPPSYQAQLNTTGKCETPY